MSGREGNEPLAHGVNRFGHVYRGVDVGGVQNAHGLPNRCLGNLSVSQGVRQYPELAGYGVVREARHENTLAAKQHHRRKCKPESPPLHCNHGAFDLCLDAVKNPVEPGLYSGIRHILLTFKRRATCTVTLVPW